MAVRKRTFTWQLVAMAEVLGLPKVGRIRPGVPKRSITLLGDIEVYPPPKLGATFC